MAAAARGRLSELPVEPVELVNQRPQRAAADVGLTSDYDSAGVAGHLLDLHSWQRHLNIIGEGPCGERGPACAGAGHAA